MLQKLLLQDKIAAFCRKQLWVWPRLSSDEKKLFDVIARAYLAALMPDFRYR
jgi:DNA topoisomerase IA